MTGKQRHRHVTDEELLLLLKKELTAREMPAIFIHLETCRYCRRRWEQFTARASCIEMHTGSPPSPPEEHSAGVPPLRILGVLPLDEIEVASVKFRSAGFFFSSGFFGQGKMQLIPLFEGGL